MMLLRGQKTTLPNSRNKSRHSGREVGWGEMRQAGSRRRSRSQESRQGAAVAAKNFDKRITQPTIAAKRGRRKGRKLRERRVGGRGICLQVQPFCSTNFENQKRNWQNKGKKGKNEAERGKDQERERRRGEGKKRGGGSVGGQASLGMTDCLHCLWIANVATANDACSSSSSGSAGTAEPASLSSLSWGATGAGARVMRSGANRLARLDAI